MPLCRLRGVRLLLKKVGKTIAWFVLIINPRRMLAFAALVPSSSREQRDRRILRGAQTRRDALCASVFEGKVTFVLEGELPPSKSEILTPPWRREAFLCVRANS